MEKPDENLSEKDKLRNFLDAVDDEDLKFLYEIPASKWVSLTPAEIKYFQSSSKFSFNQPKENEIKNITIKDSKTGVFGSYDNKITYLGDGIFRKETFGKNHDHEVLWNNKAQNLFINVNGIVGESTIKETATLLLEFYNLYVKNPIETSPKISINRLTNMYEILLPGCIVQNFAEKQKLLVEFTKYLGDNDRYYISAAISENLKGKDKNYTTRTLEINEDYDGEIKDLLADVKSSEVSMLSENVLRNLMASVTNLTITINNNFTINKDCGNTTINNNTKIIKEKTLFEKCNDFAKYIKNDKPKWYIPGEFIPKQLLTDMFNDFADVEKNVKQMNSLFKEKLFYEEKRLTKNYAGEKRRFRCIKCLSYENL